MTLPSGADWGSRVFSNSWVTAPDGPLRTIESSAGEVFTAVGSAKERYG